MTGDADIDETGMSFKELLGRYPWRAIRNCPGRYSLAMECYSGPLEELVPGAAVREYRVDAARDSVAVVWFGDGGLISYRKGEGRYLHTLNDAEGLARKLEALGIPCEV